MKQPPAEPAYLHEKRRHQRYFNTELIANIVNPCLDGSVDESSPGRDVNGSNLVLGDGVVVVLVVGLSLVIFDC